MISVAVRFYGGACRSSPTEETTMAKVSKQSAAKFEDWGPPGKEWSQVLDGQHVSFVEVGEDADLSPLLVGLPNDQCQCPHWGYVLKGRNWFRYGGSEELHEAGDAFYVPPGHTSGAFAGAEFVIFSPEKEMAEVQAHMERRVRELQTSAT